MLTGPDDASFCYRVSEALDLGYELYGSPALTVNDGTTIVAQALLCPGGDPRAEAQLAGITLGRAERLLATAAAAAGRRSTSP